MYLAAVEVARVAWQLVICWKIGLGEIAASVLNRQVNGDMETGLSGQRRFTLYTHAALSKASGFALEDVFGLHNQPSIHPLPGDSDPAIIRESHFACGAPALCVPAYMSRSSDGGDLAGGLFVQTSSNESPVSFFLTLSVLVKIMANGNMLLSRVCHLAPRLIKWCLAAVFSIPRESRRKTPPGADMLLSEKARIRTWYSYCAALTQNPESR
ncbi:hypothetical protein IW261DRAFT_1641010 [Armillaria novae-zelandiae]|uniref:Uncharacterized protein n=1 Tax=Armillaria novae-zelandiae TaxID=153914 RepID=A0AA39UH65_9AGAR|nr:hypothetical protein IW261DRAFT_1641010 [Armillaria novae-zelandiae]